MRARQYKIKVKDGFYIGDLSQVLADKVLNAWHWDRNSRDGAFETSVTGLQFAVAHIADKEGVYIKGVYRDNLGTAYPVEAGIIGICDLRLCTRKDPNMRGNVIKNYNGEVEIIYNDGEVQVKYGNETVTIDTEDDE